MPKAAAPLTTPWLKPAEAADYLGVDLRTVYAMRKDGRLKSHDLGGRVLRFHRDDLDRALGRPDPFNGLSDEQVTKLTAAVDIWPTLTAEKRELLTALLAVAPELATHRETA